MSSNNFDNISSLEKTEFSRLIELDLSNNKIKDVLAFEKVNYLSIQELNLSNNKINIINIKNKLYLPKLKTLLINNNKIKEIIIHGRVHLDKLIKVNLSNNLIETIRIEKYQKLNKLKGLKYLLLLHNTIEDIKIFGEINLKMNSLDLRNNSIAKLDVLKKMQLEDIYNLDIKKNPIKSIKALENLYFPKSCVLKVSFNLKKI